MIYGDSPVKWNERETDEKDQLGLNNYTLMPDLSAIRQSGNLYAYCMGNPVYFIDPTGNTSRTLEADNGGAGGIGILVVGGLLYIERPKLRQQQKALYNRAYTTK